jgi:formylglycine-generating enzyme required for sulfatase activity
MSFGMGINGYPAISMTQHAANKFAEWLSAKTGQFYRLPTEAEWEYACRAGTTTAYSFGDDASQLGEFAWHLENSDTKYQQVGKKKPNPWGLHDMHGNVVEWTLDQDAPYPPADGVVESPWVKATEPYPHVARGGSWFDDPEKLRCAARVESTPDWKMHDPQLPKSIWYLTDAQWLGFRVIRPLKVPSADEMYDYWNSGVENE